MTQINQIYKCEECGGVVEVVKAGAVPVCCGNKMKLMEENTVDAAREKHVPVVVVEGDTVTVKVGEVEHPMTEDHYIEWIEMISATKAKRFYIKPGEKPEAVFDNECESFIIRAYCNLHGLWKN